MSALDQSKRLALEAEALRVAHAIKGMVSSGKCFALLLFDTGEGGDLAYVSNAEREGIIVAFRDFLARQEAEASTGRAVAATRGDA